MIVMFIICFPLLLAVIDLVFAYVEVRQWNIKQKSPAR